jgi:secondary thiamine-phosphate synthase enzyme
MQFIQKEITLNPKTRGFHIITEEIVKALYSDMKSLHVGMLNIFLKHTSASLSINENADSSVRRDLESYFCKTVPNESYFEHNYEGEDDMPAHIKSSLLGVCLNIPITNGKLNLGTWQGIYLCEHRNSASKRNLILTLQER